jgi:subtilisin-like proprotein convertase family protein
VNVLAHYHPDDLDILLISPSGKKIMLMSQAGGYTSVTNTTLVFHPASQGYGQVPYQDPIPSGTTKDYSIANYGDPSQLPGAPAGPYNATLDQLAGDNLNGIWKLYIYDHAHNNGGVVYGSWSLKFQY